MRHYRFRLGYHNYCGFSGCFTFLVPGSASLNTLTVGIKALGGSLSCDAGFKRPGFRIYHSKRLEGRENGSQAKKALVQNAIHLALACTDHVGT